MTAVSSPSAASDKNKNAAKQHSGNTYRNPGNTPNNETARMDGLTPPYNTKTNAADEQEQKHQHSSISATSSSTTNSTLPVSLAERHFRIAVQRNNHGALLLLKIRNNKSPIINSNENNGRLFSTPKSDDDENRTKLLQAAKKLFHSSLLSMEKTRGFLMLPVSPPPPRDHDASLSLRPLGGDEEKEGDSTRDNEIAAVTDEEMNASSSSSSSSEATNTTTASSVGAVLTTTASDNPPVQAAAAAAARPEQMAADSGDSTMVSANATSSNNTAASASSRHQQEDHEEDHEQQEDTNMRSPSTNNAAFATDPNGSSTAADEDTREMQPHGDDSDTTRAAYAPPHTPQRIASSLYFCNEAIRVELSGRQEQTTTTTMALDMSRVNKAADIIMFNLSVSLNLLSKQESSSISILDRTAFQKSALDVLEVALLRGCATSSHQKQQPQTAAAAMMTVRANNAAAAAASTNIPPGLSPPVEGVEGVQAEQQQQQQHLLHEFQSNLDLAVLNNLMVLHLELGNQELALNRFNWLSTLFNAIRHDIGSQQQRRRLIATEFSLNKIANNVATLNSFFYGSPAVAA